MSVASGARISDRIAPPDRPQVAFARRRVRVASNESSFGPRKPDVVTCNLDVGQRNNRFVPRNVPVVPRNFPVGRRNIDFGARNVPVGWRKLVVVARNLLVGSRKPVVGARKRPVG